LIVTDLTMPEKEGLELITEVQTHSMNFSAWIPSIITQLWSHEH
jgi:YesN/AraC family two-component response regulator